MADAEPNDALARAEDAKVREEWRRLEQQRLDEEIAEAREDAAVREGRPRSRWLAWVAFAVALAAGIAVTIIVNSLIDFRR
jgi:hypothetical protein